MPPVKAILEFPCGCMLFGNGSRFNCFKPYEQVGWHGVSNAEAIVLAGIDTTPTRRCVFQPNIRVHLESGTVLTT